jgi:hypothetical protein
LLMLRDTAWKKMYFFLVIFSFSLAVLCDLLNPPLHSVHWMRKEPNS